MSHHAEDITGILKRMSSGDRAAEGELLEILYKDLRRIAAAQMRGGQDLRRLTPTELVNEAFIVLRSNEGLFYDWQNRHQFVAVAAQAMRRLLIDMARHGNARKRQHQPITIDRAENLAQQNLSPEQLIDLYDLVERVRRLSARHGLVIDNYFFLGRTLDETAAAVGVSRKTVDRDIAFLKAWLFAQLNSKPDKKSEKK